MVTFWRLHLNIETQESPYKAKVVQHREYRLNKSEKYLGRKTTLLRAMRFIRRRRSRSRSRLPKRMRRRSRTKKKSGTVCFFITVNLLVYLFLYRKLLAAGWSVTQNCGSHRILRYLQRASSLQSLAPTSAGRTDLVEDPPGAAIFGSFYYLNMLEEKAHFHWVAGRGRGLNGAIFRVLSENSVVR